MNDLSESTKALRAILFDLDGTLIDQFQAIYKAFSQVISEMGFPVPDFETVKKSVGGASESTMAKLIGQENSKEAVKRLRPIFEKEMLHGLKPLPGAMETLNFCKKTRSKPLCLQINMAHMQEQSASILISVNILNLQLVQMIQNGKNPIQA